MFEEQNDVVNRVIATLRRPVFIDPGFDARVMRAIAESDRATPARRRVWAWGLAAAAILVALILAYPGSRQSRSNAFQFVLVAPQAATVSLVGDFNDWDPARAPMQIAKGGIWATIIPLEPGRYRYAFLVNGVEWRADPSAPAARDDEFGAPSSVLTVGGS